VLAGPAARGTWVSDMPISSDRTYTQPDGSALKPPVFEMRHVAEGPRHSLILSGELDMVSAAELEAAISSLCKRGTSQLVLDLSQLTFMDVTGLRIVLFAKELCEWHRCEFALVPGPSSVQRVFELTDLVGAMPFEGDDQSDRRPAASPRAR
jgi:anti-anti-sigma factor